MDVHGWFRSALAASLILLLPCPAPAGEMDEDTLDATPPSSSPGWAPGDPQLVKALLASLQDMENLRIRRLAQGAILEGGLLTPDDMRMVVRISAGCPAIVNLCRFDPEALETAAAYLRSEMARLQIAGLAVAPVGEGLILTGTPGDPSEVGQMRKIASAFGIPLTDGTRPDAGRRMVTFEVAFTEINRQAFRETGVGWPSSLEFSDPAGARISRLAPSSSLEAVLNLLVQRGEGRILSRPLLACRSGETANFLAGGEIPIPRRTREGEVSVLWKNYGIILEVAPLVDQKGNIILRISAEISMLDRANSVDGVPGMLSRRVGTSLILTEGQTIVLSGLVNSEEATTVREVPLLASLPVLGELFRSRGFQRKETELLVSLTPRFLTSAAGHPFSSSVQP
jgi:Flp pilus assembly secretin CpaC